MYYLFILPTPSDVKVHSGSDKIREHKERKACDYSDDYSQFYTIDTTIDNGCTNLVAMSFF